MSGVYIKGMQMPKENQRGLWAVIHSDGTVEYDTGDYGWKTLRQSAFNVPDHGDLIDRQELETKMNTRSWYIGRKSDPNCLVVDAPTVIVADKEEDNG